MAVLLMLVTTCGEAHARPHPPAPPAQSSDQWKPSLLRQEAFPRGFPARRALALAVDQNMFGIPGPHQHGSPAPPVFLHPIGSALPVVFASPVPLQGFSPWGGSTGGGGVIAYFHSTVDESLASARRVLARMVT